MLPCVLDTHAADLTIFPNDDPPAFEQINHRGDGFTAILSAGTDYGDQLTERVFGAIDFFVVVFHGFAFCRD